MGIYIEIGITQGCHLVEGRGVGAKVTKGAPVGETFSVCTPTTAAPGNAL